jgi:hypothetical protein
MASLVYPTEQVTISDQEAATIFDEAAKYFLGMSGTEFLEAWSSGRFENPDTMPGVMEVASLIPLFSR